MENQLFDMIKENDIRFNELKKEIQELKKEKFQPKLKLVSLPEMIGGGFKQLGQELEKKEPKRRNYVF